MEIKTYLKNFIKGMITSVIVLFIVLIIEQILMHYDILNKLPDFLNGWIAALAFLYGSDRVK
jgi:hypothetical protein